MHDVGAPYYDFPLEDSGRVYVYCGAETGLGTSADWIAEGDQAFDFVGRSLGTAGDVNGDGIDDIVVGGFHYSPGSEDEGCVDVYHGIGEQPEPVEVDILPRKFPNVVQLKDEKKGDCRGGKKLEVALLSTPDLDARAVDP